MKVQINLFTCIHFMSGATDDSICCIRFKILIGFIFDSLACMCSKTFAVRCGVVNSVKESIQRKRRDARQCNGSCSPACVQSQPFYHPCLHLTCQTLPDLVTTGELKNSQEICPPIWRYLNMWDFHEVCNKLGGLSFKSFKGKCGGQRLDGLLLLKIN